MSPSRRVSCLNLIRCVVQRVDEDTERVVVTLNRTAVPPSPALYLRSLLAETFAAKAAATAPENPSAEAEGAQVRPWGRLEFGATTNAEVVALKEYGVVLKAVASTAKSKGGQLMVCPPQHAMDGVEEGNVVKVSRDASKVQARRLLSVVCCYAAFESLCVVEDVLFVLYLPDCPAWVRRCV